MCGIAGIVGINDPEAAGTKIRSMLGALSHRGPDSEGVHLGPGIALGHKRLKIIDLSSSADQPFFSQDDRFVMVFNGEIYNYKELASQMGLTRMRTSSDTEVLLAAYQQYGSKCLDLLNGMYAFCILDKKKNELFIARDRMGIKPLYYHFKNGVFCFASELKALLRSSLVEPNLNKDALEEYLSYHTVQAPRTLVDDVCLLEAGCSLTLRNNSLEHHRYWSFDSVEPLQDIEEKQAFKEIKTRFFSAVEKRLVSDVPIGAFLSGGIDSSAVVGAMSELSDDPVHTFTVAFNEAEFSERQYADQISKRFNTEHTVIELTARDLLEDLPEVLSSIDHPSVDGPNTYTVSKATKKAGITVAMSGLGGDEVFAGYPVFRHLASIRSNAAMKLPSAIRMSVASLGALVASTRQKKALRLLASPKDVDSLYKEFRRTAVAERYLHKEQLRRSKARVQAGLISEWGQGYLISSISSLEMRSYMESILLRDTDRMSMAHALEVRVPFLDHSLVEYALSLPDRIKKPTIPKRSLVESLDGLLPDDIVHRKKMGFTFPWSSWLKVELRELCEEQIRFLDEMQIFRSGILQERWSAFISGDTKVTWTEIWALVVLSKWIQELGLSVREI